MEDCAGLQGVLNKTSKMEQHARDAADRKVFVRNLAEDTTNDQVWHNVLFQLLFLIPM